MKNEITFRYKGDFCYKINDDLIIAHDGIIIETGKPIDGGKYQAHLITEVYESYKKLNSLWHLLLKYLAEYGSSIDWWDYNLKEYAGYGMVIDTKPLNPVTNKIYPLKFIPKSFAWEWNIDQTECYDARSKLVKKAFNYCIDNDINIDGFAEKYFEITGKRIFNDGWVEK